MLVVGTLFIWACLGHAAPEGEPATVVYVDSVDCSPGGCQARRRSLPTEEIVRERYAGGVCIEYRQRLTGFARVPSRDPELPIEVPQYERSRPVQVPCETPSRSKPLLTVQRGL
jgi:hypothetical protein